MFLSDILAPIKRSLQSINSHALYPQEFLYELEYGYQQHAMPLTLCRLLNGFPRPRGVSYSSSDSEKEFARLSNELLTEVRMIVPDLVSIHVRHVHAEYDQHCLIASRRWMCYIQLIPST